MFVSKKKETIFYNFNNFSTIEEIDRGGFGIICKAILLEETVVLKKLNEDGNEADLLNEIKHLKEVCPHPNINSLLGITKDPKTKNTIIVLNYANEGNLQSYLKKNWINLIWRKKIKFALDVANGLEHLHKFKIIHRDLCPKNILVDNGVLKIADFGCSKIFREDSLSNSKIFGKIAFIEPQCFISRQKFKRNFKSDIYSFGVIMWLISTGRKPFEDSNPYTLIQEIPKGLREKDLPQKTPSEYINIYQRSWDSDPEKRPQLIEIKKVLENLQELIELSCEYPYDLPELKENPQSSIIPNLTHSYPTNSISNFDSPKQKENLQIPQIIITSDRRHHSYSTDSISSVDSTSNLDSNKFDLAIEFGKLIIEHKLTCSLKTNEAFRRFLKDHENDAPIIFNSLQAMQHEQKDLFIALSYFHGFGIEKDDEKYLESLERACSKGVVFAVSELATCYFKGVGVEKNLEKSFELYKISVEGGFLADKCLLSEFYYYGIGGAERDPKHAFHLLRSSATVGYIPAMYWLGYCYQYGVGVTRNLENAADLYREVIQKGDYKDAKEKLETLSNQ
ncbi:12418_t:CDS:2, partial [Acaulospora morrowiae]